MYKTVLKWGRGVPKIAKKCQRTLWTSPLNNMIIFKTWQSIPIHYLAAMLYSFVLWENRCPIVSIMLCYRRDNNEVKFRFSKKATKFRGTSTYLPHRFEITESISKYSRVHISSDEVFIRTNMHTTVMSIVSGRYLQILLASQKTWTLLGCCPLSSSYIRIRMHFLSTKKSYHSV